jgi:hypothetical protein
MTIKLERIVGFVLLALFVCVVLVAGSSHYPHLQHPIVGGACSCGAP